MKRRFTSGESCSQIGAHRGLTPRSWLGWEADGQPNDDYRDAVPVVPDRPGGARLDLALAYVELAPDDAAQEINTALASERLTGSVVSRLGDLATTMNCKYPQLDVTRTVHQHSLLLAANLSRPALPSP